MILTERHIIKKSDSIFMELDNLCFLSKNLYNSALYAIRQHYFTEKKYLNWVNVNNMFVKEKQKDYYMLPCKVAQQTLKLVDQNMKSFFSLLKQGSHKARLPKYLDKTNGKFVCIYTEQAISKTELKKGFIKLSKGDFLLKTKVQKPKQVRIVPQNGFYVIEVLFEAQCNVNASLDKKYCGVDFGLNNLMTCTFPNERPIIFNGKPLKSINHFFNKRKALLQSKLKSNRKTSNQLRLITNKRNNRVNDYLHKTSKMFVNQLVSKGITDVVIGYNKEWKQGINIGRRNNQSFVQIPYYKLLNMITYKCALKGIRVNTTEERYTSKCSFLDGETIEKHDAYVGRRVKRGLFKTSQGILMNADVNGSLNILKKVVGEYVYDPILVCSMPLVLQARN